MCGFLGFLHTDRLSPRAIEAARLQSTKLSVRGNTGKGELIQDYLAFFHYRLAFRDISAGHQPMISADKNCSLVYNGEIYDFRDLRKSLKYPFQTDSDTEVLLALWQEKGENFIDTLDGEYAIALWDEKKQSLVCARDPFGVKPLYFASPNLKNPDLFRNFSTSYEFDLHGEIYISSEVKGIPMRLQWEKEGLRRQFVGLYEEIATPWDGVIQMPPGAILIAEKRNGYWKCRIERKISKNRFVRRNIELDFSNHAKKLRSLVEKSVKDRLDADVPLGAYLSGGVDSRAIVHEMWKSGYRFPTFTVGFSDADYDESGEVKKFLQGYAGIKGYLLRTNNQALEYSYQHAVAASELVQPYTNGCAKWWLSRFARKYVQGVLTGDGSDELFCGYPSYRYLAWWQFYQRNTQSKGRSILYQKFSQNTVAKPWESGVSSASDGMDLETSKKVFGWSHPLFQQIHTLAKWFVDGDSYSQSKWLSSTRDSIFSYVAHNKNSSPLQHWQNYFLYTHFPTHVLNWVGDRMEMANTLEGRPPLLSRNILEFQRSLPDGFLVRGMRDKAIFRKAYEADLGKFSTIAKKQFNAPFLWNERLGKEFLTKENLMNVGLIDWENFLHVKTIALEGKNPLLNSYANMFLQNCLVVHLLDKYLVRGESPKRDHLWEEEFLQTNTETLN